LIASFDYIQINSTTKPPIHMNVKSEQCNVKRFDVEWWWTKALGVRGHEK